MKKKDIEAGKKLTDFQKRILIDALNVGSPSKAVSPYIEKAKNEDDLITTILASEDAAVQMTQAYAELSKTNPGHWYRIRGMIGNRCVKTSSDVGGVRVFKENDPDCFVIIPNGYGDGVSRVGVFEDPNNFNHDMFAGFSCTIHGNWQISWDDCESILMPDEEGKLSGDYFVYSSTGFVVFVRYGQY